MLIPMLCAALLCASCDGLEKSVKEARRLIDPDSAIWPEKKDAEEQAAAPAKEEAPPEPEKGKSLDDIEERLISHPERIVFRYTDSQGDLHFVTGIDNVPHEYRSKVKVIDGSKLGTYDPTPIAARTPKTAARTQAETALRGRAGGAWNSNQIKWVSLASAKTEARRLQRPVMIVGYTNWCPHCKNFEKLFNDPEVATLAQKFVMVHANTDDEPMMDREYAPDGRYIPRAVFLSPTGELDKSIKAGGKSAYNFHGKTPDRLLGGMRKALGKYGD